MKILCAGLREKRSGKTTLTCALLRYFLEHNENICGFKPRSGNNLWDHWIFLEKKLKSGLLYSTDVEKYLKELNNSIPIYLLNPVHRLWLPSTYNKNWSELPNFLMDRISLDDKQIIALNQKVKSPVNLDIFQELFKKSEILNIKSREDLNSLSEYYKKAEREAILQLDKKFENLIVESYADIGLPLEINSNFDYVFVIEPFKITIYDGERYFQSSRLVSSFRIEQKTDEIIEPIKAIKTFKIPLNNSDVIENIKVIIAPFLDKLL
ncbi:MAG: hypothetical protein GF317_15980 [Candidatus Lokiarchaeota archaeon]|nr:hypothetical protein [Candidatus Lokiarchaeota archaeon]MBD3201043.1 hypothetical protein [Candidatus Lokiarchaeota archaeon]